MSFFGPIVQQGLQQLAHHLSVEAVRHGPHLVDLGRKTAAQLKEKYDDVKLDRRIQQEQAMGEHLASRYPSIEKAAEELRRRNPKLTKEQAIAKAALDDLGNTQPQSTKDLEADLSRVKVSRPYGPINSDDLSDSSLPFPDARLWPPRPPE
jgi:type I site-specific restriction endonuclease